MQMSGGGGASMERIELREIILQVDHTDLVLSTRQSVQTLLTLSHKKNDYEIIVPLELMRRARDIQRIFTIVLGSIAAISLLVGGIGIMNIMRTYQWVVSLPNCDAAPQKESQLANNKLAGGW
jgi:hypothetical protein